MRSLRIDVADRGSQRREGGIVLPQISTRPRDDDPQFGGCGRVEPGGLGAAGKLDGALRPSERPLGVGHHG